MTHDEATKKAREIAFRVPVSFQDQDRDRLIADIAAALVEASEEAAKAAYRKAAQEHAEDIQRQRMVPVPPGHILTDDGAVRKVLEWSVNPLTGRIHAEIEAAEAARKEKA